MYKTLAAQDFEELISDSALLIPFAAFDFSKRFK